MMNTGFTKEELIKRLNLAGLKYKVCDKVVVVLKDNAGVDLINSFKVLIRKENVKKDCYYNFEGKMIKLDFGDSDFISTRLGADWVYWGNFKGDETGRYEQVTKLMYKGRLVDIKGLGPREYKYIITFKWADNANSMCLDYKDSIDGSGVLGARVILLDNKVFKLSVDNVMLRRYKVKGCGFSFDSTDVSKNLSNNKVNISMKNYIIMSTGVGLKDVVVYQDEKVCGLDVIKNLVTVEYLDDKYLTEIE